METTEITEYWINNLITEPTNEIVEGLRHNELLNPYKISINVFIVIFIIVFGFLGNGCTIHILRKNASSYQNKIFMISLALIDMLACFSSFTFPFMILGIETTFTFKFGYSIGALVAYGNVYILALTAFDRFVAVYFPFKYKHFGNIRIWLVSIALTWAGSQSVMAFVFSGNSYYGTLATINDTLQLVSFLFTLISWIAICIFYTLIIIRLYNQGKRVGAVMQQ